MYSAWKTSQESCYLGLWSLPVTNRVIPGSSYSIQLSLSFLICRMRMVIVKYLLHRIVMNIK